MIIDFREKEDEGSQKKKKKYNCIFNGSFYVAITRVKEAGKLWLRSFDKCFIRTDPRVEYEIETMKIARPYKMLKVYLDEQIFEKGHEVKVGYLNINGLLDGFHADYLNGDYNLLGLDFLAVSETHLCPTIQTQQLQNILSNWIIHFRFDAPDKDPHMGIIGLVPRNNPRAKEFTHESSHHFNKGLRSQIQVSKCRFRNYLFSFVYCRTTPNYQECEWIKENTEDSFVIGDLNLNKMLEDQGNKIQNICGEENIPLLYEITTKNMNQLDHILGPREPNVFTTSFYNFVSDHKAIVLRISLAEAEFIEDERLQDFKKRKQVTLEEGSIRLSKTSKGQNQDSEPNINQQTSDTDNDCTTREQKIKIPSLEKHLQPKLQDNFTIINNWLDQNSHKFKNEIKKNYLTNPEVQDLFESVKMPDTYLPLDTQEAYFFRNVDDAIQFERYWRHERNMLHISTIQYNDEEHMKEILIWEAEHGHQRMNQPEDDFEVPAFEGGFFENDAMPENSSKEIGTSKTDLETEVKSQSQDMDISNPTNQVVLSDTDFTCQICSKPYKVFHQLKLHYKQKHNKNLQQGCLKCGGKFEKMSMFNNHTCVYRRT